MELGNIFLLSSFCCCCCLTLLRMIPSFHKVAAATAALGWYLRILVLDSPLWPYVLVMPNFLLSPRTQLDHALCPSA